MFCHNTPQGTILGAPRSSSLPVLKPSLSSEWDLSLSELEKGMKASFFLAFSHLHLPIRVHLKGRILAVEPNRSSFSGHAFMFIVGLLRSRPPQCAEFLPNTRSPLKSINIVFPLLPPVRVGGSATAFPIPCRPGCAPSLIRDVILAKEDLRLRPQLAFLILVFDFLSFILQAP